MCVTFQLFSVATDVKEKTKTFPPLDFFPYVHGGDMPHPIQLDGACLLSQVFSGGKPLRDHVLIAALFLVSWVAPYHHLVNGFSPLHMTC